ncbi:8-oxo-dGTP pyrophosphatase MutT (NUDIX family) [Allocatelliglobosispora scoriae]|uniref:8-oxo-dGTP pyrophosphatase MutT (NUDIX family) n=1 Tax=Allocatelliglobosispora scoriae TaxID=643052 RepID=A0A841BDH5_9ACTN|nr:NUDIX domain-containing protein [Allocatelliglobosispora scoriae]MBB5867157.1 8-oxo-dGTP pyrophosphatase MutT (NUDIX family) [Allocatelliglobosispora scoriae]
MTTLRIVLVALVHPDGAVLLRMRDEQSVTRSNRWSLPGGAVETGEDPRDAGRRLVAAQTGITVEAELIGIWNGFLPGVPAEVYFYAVPSTATVVVNPADFTSEFVPGADLQSGRTFTPATGYVLARFADKPRYQSLLRRPDADDLA